MPQGAGHAFALCAHCAVLFDVMSGVFFQFPDQVRNHPDVTFEWTSRHSFEDARHLLIRYGVASKVDDLEVKPTPAHRTAEVESTQTMIGCLPTSSAS